MKDNIRQYQKILENQQKYVMPTYAPSLMLTKGKGSYVWDKDNNKYLDFSCGISVCNLGHCHPAVNKAIKEQCDRLIHVSNLFINELQPVLAKKIADLVFDGKVFFSNSGAEANEGMIKFARKWGNPKGKYEIITMDGSFHGRTLTTLAATGRAKYRKGFEPDVKGFKHVPFNDMESIKKAVKESDGKIAAILIEPIQGEGGVIPAEHEYMKNLREYCTENEILLLFDEVQSGIGRSGKFFACQHYGVVPDVMSMAKALGNGYPIGAFIAKKSLGDILTPGTHASTFGGTPLACAAAIAVIDTFQIENILKNVLEMSKKSLRFLSDLSKKHSMIQQVRGKGLMLGIVLDKGAKEASEVAEKNGLLLITAGENVLRFYPPLNVKENELIEAINILDKVFKYL
jgi:acetylornithine/N-succinyldiaminopimelate aminotransferase